MELFSAGQKIALLLTKDESLIEITAKVEIVEDDRLIINLPQYFMRYVDQLQVGSDLTVKAFSKYGTIDFNSIVITSPLEDYFSIELDYNAIKFTPSDDIPMVEAVEKLNIKKDGHEYKLKTFGISAEYIKFSSNDDFVLDEIIDCSLALPNDYGIINFRAMISEIDPVYEHEYTAKYLSISESDRQNLLYYMYMYDN